MGRTQIGHNPCARLGVYHRCTPPLLHKLLPALRYVLWVKLHMYVHIASLQALHVVNKKHVVSAALCETVKVVRTLASAEIMVLPALRHLGSQLPHKSWHEFPCSGLPHVGFTLHRYGSSTLCILPWHALGDVVTHTSAVRNLTCGSSRPV